METIPQFHQIISQHQNFILTTHVNPDGDGLGSELALARFLRKLGKNALIFNHNATPDQYTWMDCNNDLRHFNPQTDGDSILNAEVIVILDTNQPDRLRALEPFVRKSPGMKVVIDHHLEPNPFGDLYIIDDDATSTGEIVYRILTHINAELIDKPIAEALYTAIMTDTGSFRFPRTDPEIHHITAHLLQKGVDPTTVFSNIYERWTPNRMRLLGEILDSMQTAYHGKLAYVVCTQAMFRSTGTTEVETDNFTSYPMSVRGVVIGILFNELPNGVKISFRSKGNIPINELAKEFGGNGHLNAAGARLFDVRLEDVVEEVVAKAGKYISG